MATGRRTFRVADEIRTTIAMNLTRASDPRLELVSVTRVVVTPDLKIAKVYWGVPPGKGRREEAEVALKGAERYFRKVVAEEIRLRVVPQIFFYYDDTLDELDRVNRLLNSVRDADAERTPLSEDGNEGV